MGVIDASEVFGREKYVTKIVWALLLQGQMTG